MGKMTGMEQVEEIPAKVLALYEAVAQIIEGDEDINSVRVLAITERAGIGKGTAYEYFDSKEELLSCAVVYHTRQLANEIRAFLKDGKGFADKMDMLLQAIEREGNGAVCKMVRYVHVLTDHSEFSRLTKEKMATKEMRKNLIIGIFEEIVDEALLEGELRTDLPKSYIVETIFARLLTHMIFVSARDSVKEEAQENRERLYRSMLDELCEKNR